MISQLVKTPTACQISLCLKVIHTAMCVCNKETRRCDVLSITVNEAEVVCDRCMRAGFLGFILNKSLGIRIISQLDKTHTLAISFVKWNLSVFASAYVHIRVWLMMRRLLVLKKNASEVA